MRIEVAVTRVAVGRHGDPKARALDPQHRRIPAGRDHRRIADHVVVAAEHAAAAREVRAGEQAQQRRAGVGERWEGIDLEPERRLGSDADEAPHRRAVGQQLDRKACHVVPSVDHGQLAVVGDLTDDS